jgi:hypothetical protein
MFYINVGANAESLHVVLDCPNVDFDTYGRLGSEPTTSTYDWRGYTSGGEDNTVSGPAQGIWYIMVQRYSGDGSYSLTATVTYAAVDTISPTVSISNPSNGVTVSGTVSVSFTASDANGISSRTIQIDGVTKSTSSSYSWDTTAYSAGSHTVTCTATDPSGNTGSDTHTVTVDNAVSDEGGALTNGVAASGSLSASDLSDMWYIDIGANAESLHVVLTCGTADFDTYGKAGSEPTTSSYDWRGYTYGGEDNTVSSPAQARHYIMVQRYSGDGGYSLTATVTYAAVDTTAPSVSISSPSNGATVSGTTSISFTASDANGISSRTIQIDGSTVSTATSYSWDTTAYSDGSHTITCTATDPSGNTGSDTHTVTVDNAPADEGGQLTDGVAANGHMSESDGSDMWYINVGANAQSMQVVLTCGSADFDTYGKAGSEPTTSSYDWKGYTSGGEDNTVSNPAQGTHYIMVDWYSGDDDYVLTATITYEVVDTTAPSVSISSPSNGATVSGTVSISFTASDANGIASQSISIDGSTVSTGSSYSWDTTAVGDGSHTIICSATDPSSNTGSDTHSVTVDNSGSGGNVLSDGVPASGSLAAQGDTEMWTMQVPSGKASMYSVLTCGSADFDLYGRFGAEPTTDTYDWRGYTSGGEEVSFSNPNAGTWYIMVRSYSGSGSYELTVTLNDPVSTDWGDGGKYAILVGISDYASINDLSYCDEDATDWYNFLDSQGYECHIYGDTHTSNYPVYHGDATEANVRSAIQELALHAQSGDKVFFATSGHGDGDGNGNSYLCMYDCSGSTGCYYDYELAADIDNFVAGVQVGVFIDHCYSGGMGPELMAASNSQYIYCTTTCTEDGYGYDEPDHQNGAWTYEYLEKYQAVNPTWTMEYTYDQASSTYPHTGGDACMEFDGDSSTDFTF